MERGVDPDAPEIVGRLLSEPNLAWLPRGEAEWLVSHGRLETWEAGSVIGPAGRRIETLWIILSGHIAVDVDRGAGPRRVIDWKAGEVSGMLPYSRMTAPPGDNRMQERTEVLVVHERHFPDLACACPVFTARSVHLMLDRARSFNTSALQDEKMLSLGKLAAGLAHELNNPASAAARGANLLGDALAEFAAASRRIGALDPSGALFERLERERSGCKVPGTTSPGEQIALEDEIVGWLDRQGRGTEHAPALAEMGLGPARIAAFLEIAPPEGGEAVLDWLAAGCAAQSLAADVERATERIHGLVAAVKNFTYMDTMAGPEPVEVEPGLRDTMALVGSKTKQKGATLTLAVEPDLPKVYATGAELNQVWMNLVDNALDAIEPGGTVHVDVRRELDRVAVRVTDDGPGIPETQRARVFDAFYTTKPPGEGTGLGLDIARRLVRRYRGDISVGSPQKGAEFKVTLEVAQPSGARGG